jgi:hypothetical protein
MEDLAILLICCRRINRRRLLYYHTSKLLSTLFLLVFCDILSLACAVCFAAPLPKQELHLIMHFVFRQLEVSASRFVPVSSEAGTLSYHLLFIKSIGNLCFMHRLRLLIFYYIKGSINLQAG